MTTTSGLHEHGQTIAIASAAATAATAAAAAAAALAHSGANVAAEAKAAAKASAAAARAVADAVNALQLSAEDAALTSDEVKHAAITLAKAAMALAIEEAEMAKEKVDAIHLEKAKFLAKMSHEMRTPMNAVIGMTDLVLTTKLTEMQMKNLGYVKSGGMKLLALIDDLLDITNIESGRMSISQIKFSIGDVMREAALTTKLLIGDKPIVCESVLASHVPDLLIGDPLRFYQILGNLLNNAVKFTEAGTIAMTAKIEQQNAQSVMLKISISDTGKGIPLDKQEIIFHYFTQLDDSIYKMYEGAGLGLFIAKELVEKMGGKIGVDSEPGRGSNFHFTVNFKIP